MPEIELKSLIHLTKSHLVTIHSLYATGLPLTSAAIRTGGSGNDDSDNLCQTVQILFCLQMFQKKYWLSSVCRSNEFTVNSTLSFILVQQLFVVGDFTL